MLKSYDDKTPSCFGSLFDPNAKECMGGYDVAFTDGHGGHVRSQCDYVGTCSQRVQQNRSAPKLIPPGSLVRPHTTFSGPQAYTRPTAPSLPTAGTPPGPRPWSPPSQHLPQGYPPQSGLQQMMPVNFSIPQFLTVREPVTSGNVVKRLSWEVFRSMGKAIGHTLANFFDSEAFGFRPPPPRPDEEGHNR